MAPSALILWLMRSQILLFKLNIPLEFRRHILSCVLIHYLGSKNYGKIHMKGFSTAVRFALK